MLPKITRHELYAVAREVHKQKSWTNSTVLEHLQTGYLKATLYVGDPAREIEVPVTAWNEFTAGQFKIRVRRNGRWEKRHFRLSADFFIDASIEALLSPLADAENGQIETTGKARVHLPSIAQELKKLIHIRGCTYPIFVRHEDWLAYAEKLGVETRNRSSGGRPKIASWDVFWQEVAICLIVDPELANGSKKKFSGSMYEWAEEHMIPELLVGDKGFATDLPVRPKPQAKAKKPRESYVRSKLSTFFAEVDRRKMSRELANVEKP